MKNAQSVTFVFIFVCLCTLQIEMSQSQMNQFKFKPGESRKETCEANTFCEEVSKYPSDHISRVVEDNLEKFQAFFGTDFVEVMPTQNRNAFVDTQEVTLCGSYTMIKFPKTAQSSTGEWNYIVNDERRNYTQGIRVEMCM